LPERLWQPLTYRPDSPTQPAYLAQNSQFIPLIPGKFYITEPCSLYGEHITDSRAQSGKKTRRSRQRGCHNAKQLGEIISHDPALTARILRIVNSAYYSLANKVELVSRAVSIVGEEDLRNLVLATSAVDSFKRIPNQLVDIDLFWRHSVHTGIISRLLSKHCNILHGERLFVAGMLHDIGKLVLYYKEPELSQQVLIHAAESEGRPIH